MVFGARHWTLETVALVRMLEEHVPLATDIYASFRKEDMDAYLQSLVRAMEMSMQTGKVHYVVTYPVPKQPYKTLSILKLRRGTRNELGALRGSSVAFGRRRPPIFFFRARVNLQHIIPRFAQVFWHSCRTGRPMILICLPVSPRIIAALRRRRLDYFTQQLLITPTEE